MPLCDLHMINEKSKDTSLLWPVHSPVFAERTWQAHSCTGSRLLLRHWAVSVL